MLDVTQLAPSGQWSARALSDAGMDPQEMSDHVFRSTTPGGLADTVDRVSTVYGPGAVDHVLNVRGNALLAGTPTVGMAPGPAPAAPGPRASGQPDRITGDQFADTLYPALSYYEDYRRDSYPDPLTHGAPWTSGVGHTRGVRPGQRRSDAQIMQDYRGDVNDAVADLDREMPWWRGLDPDRQKAMVTWTFQNGIGGVQQFHNAVRAIRGGDWAGAEREMKRSLWARQSPERVHDLSRTMRTGAFRSSYPQPAWFQRHPDQRPRQ